MLLASTRLVALVGVWSRGRADHRNPAAHALPMPRLRFVRHVTLLVLAPLAMACSHTVGQINASKPSFKPAPACASVVQIDTAGWTLTADSAVGVELLLPSRYVAQHWSSVKEPEGLVSADWWRDNRPQTTIELGRLSDRADTARSHVVRQRPVVGECLLHTSSGPASMVVYRSGVTYVNGQTTEPFLVRVEWPSARGQRRRFLGAATDSMSRDEQIRIATTLRWFQRDSA
jgi:hypothetical protein